MNEHQIIRTFPARLGLTSVIWQCSCDHIWQSASEAAVAVDFAAHVDDAGGKS